MPAQLLALNDGPSIPLDKPILLLGRDLECDIRLDSRKISRRHCCIAQVGEQLVVRDLGSTNGVRINGVRVLEGHLKAGDEFTIGNFRYQVRWDSVDAGAAAALPAVGRPAPRLEKAEPVPVDHRGSTDRPPNEDDILEECEEPVPLSDPPVEPKPVAVAKVPPAATLPPGDSVPPLPPPQPRHQNMTQILPDEEELQLAPASDVFPHGDQAKPKS